MKFQMTRVLFLSVIWLLPCFLKADFSQERISAYSSRREAYEVMAICSPHLQVVRNLKELGWNCKQFSIRRSLREQTYLSSITDVQQLEISKSDFHGSRLIYIEGLELQNLCVLQKLLELTKNPDISVCLDLSKKAPNLPVQTLFAFIESHIDVLILSKKALSSYAEGKAIVFPSKTTVIYGDADQGWVQKGQKRYRFQSSNPSLFSSGILHGILRQKPIEHCLGFALIINRSYDARVQSLSESAWKEIRKILKANEK